MLETLISSRTRIKLLVRLFLNPASTAYLRGLADEFHESTNAVRLELNRFEDAGMLTTKAEGNKKIYQANQQHPLFQDVHNILLKYIGIDRIINSIVEKTGNLKKVLLIGDYAEGKDSGIIDLLFVGEINTTYIINIIVKAEQIIGKKIRYLNYSEEEWNKILAHGANVPKYILLWGNDKNIE